MKKAVVVIYFVMVSMLAICTVRVHAVYTTSSSMELTDEEYNKLSDYFFEATIDSMPQEELQYYIKESDKLSVTTETRYEQTEEFFSKDHVLQKVVTKEIEEKDMKAALRAVNSENSNTHTTAYKKITTRITSVTGGYMTIAVENEWLKLPTVRSYDVIGVRPTSRCTLYTTGNIKNVWGRQDSDVGRTDYAGTSSHVKIKGTKIGDSYVMSGSGGAGISMNLYDNATRITCTFGMTVMPNTEVLSAFGTYQHATETVSLAESQNYSFSQDGYGNVFLFAASVRNKYDYTQGMLVSHKW